MVAHTLSSLRCVRDVLVFARVFLRVVMVVYWLRGGELRVGRCIGRISTSSNVANVTYFLPSFFLCLLIEFFASSCPATYCGTVLFLSFAWGATGAKVGVWDRVGLTIFELYGRYR